MAIQCVFLFVSQTTVCALVFPFLGVNDTLVLPQLTDVFVIPPTDITLVSGITVVQLVVRAQVLSAIKLLLTKMAGQFTVEFPEIHSFNLLHVFGKGFLTIVHGQKVEQFILLLAMLTTILIIAAFFTEHGA